MKSIVFVLILFMLMVVIAWVVFASRNAVKSDKRTVRISGHEFSVEIADTALARMKGLSGHAPLAENEGMLFVFNSPGNHGFWMKGMHFPLDFIWIREGRIVGITSGVPVPSGMMDFNTYYPPEPVDMVLEVNAGIAERHGLTIGDAITYNK